MRVTTQCTSLHLGAETDELPLFKARNRIRSRTAAYKDLNANIIHHAATHVGVQIAKQGATDVGSIAREITRNIPLERPPVSTVEFLFLRVSGKSHT
jgi:hypothetical protein